MVVSRRSQNVSVKHCQNELYNSETRSMKLIAMNALRMIKLFGWESRVKDQISEKREEELTYIWQRKLIGLANNMIK